MGYEKRYTIEEVREIVGAIIGKTFGELNNYKKQTGDYTKGSFGHVLEEDVFHYAKNSKSSPDLEDVGIELKMTPYKINKNGTLSAKERLVLNIINYMEEYKNDFYSSHFWFKNKLIQIVWYLHEKNKAKNEFVITNELLFSFPKDDLCIIKNDWESIINKIKEGKAHELSEADTMYLGACTKGVDSSSVRQQPFSSIMAKQRAFCLKSSYMTQLVRSHIGKEKYEKITKGSIELTFEQEIELRLNKYKGSSIDKLKERFEIETKTKNLNEIIVARMLGVKGKISNTEEFLKANIVLKTIRIKENGNIVESMSFPAFKFLDIVNEKWEESDLYQLFYTTKFMFVVFKEKNGDYFYDHIKLWNMPMTVLENEVREIWFKTVDVIKNGEIVKNVINGKRITNFPGMSTNGICHVRPHAVNSFDTYDLPVIDKLTGVNEYTKQCFWLNNSYIKKIINS